MRVKCELPENLPEEYESYFRSKDDFESEVLTVRTVKNVFLSHEGIAMKRLSLVPKTQYNVKGSEDATFYWDYYKLGLEQMLVSRYGSSLECINLKDGEFLSVHSKWFGYFFWITDCIPKLIKTSSRHSEIRLIVPESWKKIKYVSEALNLFPDIKGQSIPAGVHLKISKLVLPETRKWSNAFSIEDLMLVRNFLIEKASNLTANPTLKKIHISRSKAKTRKYINSVEVLSVLSKAGFQDACLEDYSLLEQVSLLNGADQVVGLHGAGLTNILFLNPGAKVIELGPKPNKKSDLRISFWRLANCCELEYSLVFNEVEQKKNYNIYDCDLVVDVHQLKTQLKKFGNEF
jgi:capsular polysaccharide biosynthesis protein